VALEDVGQRCVAAPSDKRRVVGLAPLAHVAAGGARRAPRARCAAQSACRWQTPACGPCAGHASARRDRCRPPTGTCRPPSGCAGMRASALRVWHRQYAPRVSCVLLCARMKTQDGGRLVGARQRGQTVWCGWRCHCIECVHSSAAARLPHRALRRQTTQ
jgi:hypothetical protein